MSDKISRASRLCLFFVHRLKIGHHTFLQGPTSGNKVYRHPTSRHPNKSFPINRPPAVGILPLGPPTEGVPF